MFITNWECLRLESFSVSKTAVLLFVNHSRNITMCDEIVISWKNTLNYLPEIRFKYSEKAANKT